MRKRTLGLLTIATIYSGVQTAWGQAGVVQQPAHPLAAYNPAPDKCGCHAALVKDYIASSNYDQYQLQIIDIIDENTFRRLKLDTSGTISIPYLKGLLDASGTFSAFEENRRKFFQSHQYTSNSVKAASSLQIVTNPIAYSFWAQCMTSCAQTNEGFFAWREYEDGKSMVINYRWTAPGILEPRKLQGTLSGGAVKGAPRGRLFAPNATVHAATAAGVHIDRTGRQKIVASLSAVGDKLVVLTSEYDVPADFGTARVEVRTPTEVWELVKVLTGFRTVTNPHCFVAPGFNPFCGQDDQHPAPDWVAGGKAGVGDLNGMVLQVEAGELRNPKVWCLKPNEPGWENGSLCLSKDSADIYPGVPPRLVNGDFKSYAKKASWAISAEWWLNHKTDGLAERYSKTTKLVDGNTFSVLVPRVRTGAALRITVGGSEYLVNVGDSAAHVHLEGKPFLLGDDEVYTYRAVIPPAPTSVVPK